MSISVCMIVKNETEVLERCLQCLYFVDEIIIVCTGDNPATKEIAAKYGEVFDFEWCDDFSAARNYAFSLATCDYCMWLDADDYLTHSTISKLETLDLTADAYFLPYQVAFDESGCTLQYYRERIVRRSCGFKWKEPVHECMEVSGDIKYVDIPIEHRPGPKESSTRNLDIYRARESAGEPFSARAMYYYARELKDHQLWCESMYKFQDFIKRPDGWTEDKISACIGLSEVYIQRGMIDEALGALDHSFSYDLPRPEVCCRIGNVYFERRDMERAVFWYNLALTVPVPTSGFVFADYLDFIPSIQLAVCYDRMGQREKAMEFNERAGAIKPRHPSYLHNKNYFESASLSR